MYSESSDYVETSLLLDLAEAKVVQIESELLAANEEEKANLQQKLAEAIAEKEEANASLLQSNTSSTKWAFTLPTEAQWEYACRAGTTTPYSWGANASENFANFNDSGYEEPREVGQYGGNAWGFFDMHGNVWEWTADWYAPYPTYSQTDPAGPGSGTDLVLRGGGFGDSWDYIRSATRQASGTHSSMRNHDIGFRISLQKVPVEKIPFTFELDLNSTVELEMIHVEPGTFTMGSPESEQGRQGDETQHEVTLTQEFFLSKYEVTQAQYEAVMAGNSEGLNATPSRYPDNPNRPVEKVSYDDIQVFFARLNEQQADLLSVISESTENLQSSLLLDLAEAKVVQIESELLAANEEEKVNLELELAEAIAEQEEANASLLQSNTSSFKWAFTLPTEAQWEYACRAGSTTAYSWGASASENFANFNDSGYEEPREVGQYGGNAWGFFDMHGNVWEWTADWYAPYPTYSQTDPTGPGSGTDLVLRGGGFGDSWDYIRSATRQASGTDSSMSNHDIGFRISLQKVPVEKTPFTFELDLNSTVELEMIHVEPGTFTMGSPESEQGRQGDETQHEVTLTQEFFLSKYEVTQAQYEAVMTGNSEGLNASPSRYPGNPNRPVEKVSYDDIQVFFARLNEQQAPWLNVLSNLDDKDILEQALLAAQTEVWRLESELAAASAAEKAALEALLAIAIFERDAAQKALNYANDSFFKWAFILPTEAQWEYACRAGTTTAYSWGANASENFANFNDSGYEEPREVGQYGGNGGAFSICMEMCGNGQPIGMHHTPPIPRLIPPAQVAGLIWS